MSKSSQKPLLLFFTGSDWCVWCKKLENEVFENRDFLTDAKDHFIFVKIDFPMKSTLSTALTKQNESLRQRFAIEYFPTLIMLDSKENVIGKTGYQSGGGKKFARHLLTMAKKLR